MRSEYIQGKMDRKILDGLIFKYLLDNCERYKMFNGNRDRWADFVGWLYPRLSRAVDLYRDSGTTFDTYINAIIQWSSKEYKRKEAEHVATEYVFWKSRAEEMEARCNDPEYGGEDGINKSLSDDHEVLDLSFLTAHYSCRQILILFLKSYYFASDELINKIAETTGIDKKELYDYVEKLHHMRAGREQKLHTQKEMVFSQYYRCLSFQKRLSQALPGTARYDKLQNYLDRAQMRFKSMKRRLGRIRADATNRQISEVLNIPKGTVDSALFSIKGKLEKSTGALAEKKNERYHAICSATAMVSMQAISQT